MSNNTVEEYQHGRCKIRIELDPDPQNPRLEFDHAGTMACAHCRYNLGDEPYQKRGFGKEYLNDLAEPFIRDIAERVEFVWDHFANEDSRYVKMAERYLEKARAKALADHFVILPLCIYDHSGITMFIGSRGDYPFDSAGWDTSSVGFIHCSLEKAQSEWGIEAEKEKGWDGLSIYRTSAEDKKACTLREAAEKYLEGEVEEYDQYLTGQVYGYVVEAEDGEEDSCWGFFGEIEYVKSEAESMAAHHNKRMAEADALAELTEKEAELAAVWP
jgi:hypothetical protein